MRNTTGQPVDHFVIVTLPPHAAGLWDVLGQMGPKGQLSWWGFSSTSTGDLLVQDASLRIHAGWEQRSMSDFQSMEKLLSFPDKKTIRLPAESNPIIVDRFDP